MDKLSFLILVIVFNNAFAQSNLNISLKPRNTLELNIGMEIYRSALTGGLGYNIFFSQHFAFVPELNLVGVPILSGSLKFNTHIQKALVIESQAGIGLLPVGFLVSTSGVLGIGIKYKISKNIFLISSLKQYVIFPDDVISFGPSSFEKKNVHDFPPLVFSVGISL